MNDSYGGSSGLSSAYSLIYQSQEQFDLDADTPDEELEPDQSGKIVKEYFYWKLTLRGKIYSHLRCHSRL